MSSTTELDQEQLAAARASAWKQAGEPLLTLEAARDWINELGLVLFSPRPQLAAPAPSLVEATLGHAEAAPSAAQSGVARGLVARLAGAGLALPLNLLGGVGDSPDFVVSAQVFSYVFTMRGDKLWKQPPSTSEGARVSPLGLRVFEALTERGALSAKDLATELGREVTETAIVRALDELWAQLRVIPLLSSRDAAEAGGETLWELTTHRFTKAIKAGANAGQPTALSALVSLYLAQVYAASEEEAAAFLSPLTARSRVREVLHALLGARQLETFAIDGKTLLHIPGTLPEARPATPTDEKADGDGAEDRLLIDAVAAPAKVGTGRISRFSAGAAAPDRFRGKPARSLGAEAGRSARPGERQTGERRAGESRNRESRNRESRTGESRNGNGRAGAARYGEVRKDEGRSAVNGAGRSNRERRPFSRAAAAGPRPPSFTKPWEEGRPRKNGGPAAVDRQRPGDRPRAAGKPRDPGQGTAPAAAGPDAFRKFRKPAPQERVPLGPREQAGLPPERRSAPAGRGAWAKGPGPRAERGSSPHESRARGPRREGTGSRDGAPFQRGSGQGGARENRPFAGRPKAQSGQPAETRPFQPRGTKADSRSFRGAPSRGPWAQGFPNSTNRGQGSGSRPRPPRAEGAAGPASQGDRRPAGPGAGRFKSGQPGTVRSGTARPGSGKSGFAPSQRSGGSRGAADRARGPGVSRGKPEGFRSRPSGSRPSGPRSAGSRPSGSRDARQTGSAQAGPRRKPEAGESE